MQRSGKQGPDGVLSSQASRSENIPGSVGGRGRIRTSVGYAGDFTDRSLWPLGHPPGNRQDSIRPKPLDYGDMAKDAFSFDVVSVVDLQEVRNAVDQASREIVTRFDFKGTETSMALDNDLVEVRSQTENRLKAAIEVFREKLVRRSVSLKAVSEGPMLPASHGSVRRSLHINQGIDEER